MKVKEYLGQAYRLDQRINSDIEELGKLREMSSSIASPCLEERVQTSRNTDAPFVRSLMKIMELEDKINAEIDNLVELKSRYAVLLMGLPIPMSVWFCVTVISITLLGSRLEMNSMPTEPRCTDGITVP